MYGTAPMPPRLPGDDIDLYCLNCAYNLRGLSGDPRRCPECGYLNPMGSLELPAEIISKQLRRMESSPVLCVGTAAVLILGTFPMIALLADGLSSHNGDFAPFFYCCTPQALAGGLWLLGVSKFRSSCGCKPGWIWALTRFHVYGLAMVSLVILAVAAGMQLVSGMVSFSLVTPYDQRRAAFTLLMLLLSLFLIAVIIFGMPWLHRRSKREMESLQRETAVRIARERLREDLAKAK